MHNENGRLLSVKEVAERLNLPVSSVQRRLWQRLWLPVIKIGRRTFVAEKDLEEFIASRREMPVAKNQCKGV